MEVLYTTWVQGICEEHFVREHIKKISLGDLQKIFRDFVKDERNRLCLYTDHQILMYFDTDEDFKNCIVTVKQRKDTKKEPFHQAKDRLCKLLEVES
ncbi:hypothetical protein [Eubacterium oxidoreducens]|uniref:Uncharacterized protein n=1 Tax=Eubacterium oxidoreducens TaxID=1732 RepID=A0A1G6B399_EUBOX|nr:hypothetical protein [Eubacterium oxidoreducens]SDB15075.1 hypothetical protein SAMN02910417_01109 [Eubacterium oxidoreducens]